jgi:hypothetical protein
MADVLTIYIQEEDDATAFKLYDQTDWTLFAHGNVTVATMTLEYNSTTYTYTTGTGLLVDLGMGATFTNLCGTNSNSYFSVTPAVFYNGSTQLNATYFPDGYYEITLNITYSAVAKTDTSYQGFLSETYQMAAQLPLQIDMNDFDYEENRLQFLCIALLQSCKWAGELGRSTQFTKFTDKVNDLLSARNISGVWSN